MGAGQGRDRSVAELIKTSMTSPALDLGDTESSKTGLIGWLERHTRRWKR